VRSQAEKETLVFVVWETFCHGKGSALSQLGVRRNTAEVCLHNGVAKGKANDIRASHQNTSSDNGIEGDKLKYESQNVHNTKKHGNQTKE
jgi:hypothetical protein